MINGVVCGFLVLGVGTKDGWTNSTQTKKERAFLDSVFLFSAFLKSGFSFLRRKEKGMCAFLNSVLLFSAERKKEIRLARLIFHFLVGHSTKKSAEILDLLVERKVHAPSGYI